MSQIWYEFRYVPHSWCWMNPFKPNIIGTYRKFWWWVGTIVIIMVVIEFCVVFMIIHAESPLIFNTSVNATEIIHVTWIFIAVIEKSDIVVIIILIVRRKKSQVYGCSWFPFYCIMIMIIIMFWSNSSFPLIGTGRWWCYCDINDFSFLPFWGVIILALSTRICRAITFF